MSSGTRCKAVAHKKHKKQFISKWLNSVFIVIILSLNSVLTFWNQGQMYHPYHAIPIQCLGWNMFEVKPRDWGLVLAYEGGICALDSLNSGQQSLFICCLSCNFMHCHYSCTFDPVIGWAEETELLSCLPQDWGSQWQGGDRLPGSSITSSTEKGADHSPTGNGLRSTYRSTIS